MGDLRNPKLIYLKAGLFLILGLICGGVILVEHPTITTAVCLLLAIWSFARCYYFAFYVVEKYVDPTYKFAGLGSFLLYLIKKPQQPK